MAGKITTNSVVLGDSVTDTQNFVLKTNADGTATLARGALGALGTVFGVNGSGALTGATLVAPALGTPASGVLTNCTGVVAGALPAGSVLQVVSANTITLASSSSSTFADTTLTASITPRSASSKILIIVTQQGVGRTTNNNSAQIRLMRDATVIQTTSDLIGYTGSTSPARGLEVSMNCLDSPATTSSITYKTQFNSKDNNASVAVQDWGSSNNATSTITLMEIAG